MPRSLRDDALRSCATGFVHAPTPTSNHSLRFRRIPMRGGPTIKHLDDVPAEEMLRFRFRDGSTASVWEKWIELSPNYVAFWNRWDPGAMTAPHGHTGDHVNFILSGEIRSKHGVARAGSHI